MVPYRGETPTCEYLDHLEMATMSDKPLGPDWWQASDGTWYPPELHPSMQGAAPSPAQAPDSSSLAPSTIAPVPTADEVHLAPVAQMPSVVPGAHAAPVTPVVPMPSMEPVAQVAPAVPVAQVAEVPSDAPLATVEMPGFGSTPPQPVPSLADMQAHPSWSGESDLRPSAGPMFPDMFQQAVADSQLVNAASMNFGDREHGDSLDVQHPSGSMGESELVAASPFRMPAEVGAFTGVSAKKRRWHH
jgi:hypothetical protein